MIAGRKKPGRWRLAIQSLKQTPAVMDDAVELIRSEISDVEDIVQVECWLEGERRGRAVDRQDPAVQQRVADIILGGAGAALRRKHLAPRA